ncbi:Helicase associated domain protein [Streptomyces bambusae]|uniref:DEAD/DEAH box helicase n=1 Tax=Streptomyces bambusae TaxID=1550616 RepID=UPI001CFCC0B9|nr:DEAD/DEAH box helicase [Streptomyces bambusae]MCB5164326.1 Helicase associated domain protein [Streptomyces bambusae]
MARMELRPHQREAVDAVLRALTPPPGGPHGRRGLRTQVIMATGSGKTLVAARAAEELRAHRVLVLVPSLDLLTQSAAGWRQAGRHGPVVGVSSLREADAGFRNTTDAGQLAAWCRESPRVTVFATYASLGLGVIERAHRSGLPEWDLVVVDEAHRTSGRIGKAWAVVHDNERVPAVRRLYMTATPRLWQAGEEEQAGRPGAEKAGAGELVASMEDDPAGPFGAVCHELTLSEAIDRGIVAPYQVVCVDVTDPGFQAAVLLGADARSDAVRGARLAALQTAAVKAATEEGLGRTLVFHQLTKEAEAFAAGLPEVARRLHHTDRARFPREVWADWLCGEHRPAHRREVLERFATARGGFLSSVRVLGEGVDTRSCDSVFWADVRGSMPDLVQAVGRALRIRPGEGKVASLVVPVLLGPGERPDDMLSSRAYGDLARLLEALRAHDARVVEALAQPQAPGAYQPTGRGAGRQARGLSGPARELLKFSVPRDPAALAAFISLRILSPETTHWNRGLAAAAAYAQQAGDLRVPFGYRTPQGPEALPGGPADFPLGQWIADARRARKLGRLAPERAARLDALGMVWSHFDVAFEEGLAAAQAWAAEHGHLLAPLDTTWQGYPLGVWLKNNRAAARRGAQAPGGLSEERRQALEDIDAAWCPDWPISWQRCFRLVRLHTAAGGAVPQVPGERVVQGEDLGAWVQAQRLGWDGLAMAQQWMLQHVLGLLPAEAGERPPARVPHPDKWAANLAAARQFAGREGHLKVPRTHVETVGGTAYRLGAWVANARSRAARLAPERVAQLDALGMRWAESGAGRR